MSSNVNWYPCTERPDPDEKVKRIVPESMWFDRDVWIAGSKKLGVEPGKYSFRYNHFSGERYLVRPKDSDKFYWAYIEKINLKKEDPSEDGEYIVSAPMTTGNMLSIDTFKNGQWVKYHGYRDFFGEKRKKVEGWLEIPEYKGPVWPDDHYR